MASAADVTRLRALVARAEKDDDDIALADEIEPVAGTMVDPKFPNALTDRLGIAEMAKFETAEAQGDPPLRVSVLQAHKPGLEDSGHADVKYLSLIDDRRPKSKT